MTRGILFCTPCYGGMVVARHMGSCLSLKEELTKIGLAHDWLLGTNESLVHRARNEMTATFLKTDYSHMMWLDADIEFAPEDVAKVWNLGTDVAVGCYAMKKPGEDWYAAWVGGKLVKDLDKFGESPVQVDYAGTGFMLIDRKVLEVVAMDVETYDGPDGKVSAFYQTPIWNGGFESEDYHFCRIVREHGFKVMMDPTVRLKHWGMHPYGA